MGLNIGPVGVLPQDQCLEIVLHIAVNDRNKVIGALVDRVEGYGRDMDFNRNLDLTKICEDLMAILWVGLQT
jgi:hypothetical protein